MVPLELLGCVKAECVCVCVHCRKVSEPLSVGLEGVSVCVCTYLSVPLSAPVSTRVSVSVCTLVGVGA